jgi:hypothetical protein
MNKLIANRFNKIAAVIVPIYKNSFSNEEIFSINLTLNKLSEHDIYLLAPDKITIDFSIFNKKRIKNVSIIYIDYSHLRSRYTYTRLLISRNFYRLFSCYEYILIVQPDALVFSDSLLEWCRKDYSYVGAPWFEGLKEPIKPLRIIGSGNGGFSLRKVEHFLTVLESIRFTPLPPSFPLNGYKAYINRTIFAFNRWPFLPLISEDLYWGLVVPPHFNYFSVPTPEISIKFSFETEPEYLYKLNNFNLPFGCHAWTKYGVKFWKNILKEHHL